MDKHKIGLPGVIRTKPGYTVNQLIVKLQKLSEKGFGDVTMAIALPPKTINGPVQLAVAGEGIIGKASDGRLMCVVMPNLDEGLINPFKGNTNGN